MPHSDQPSARASAPDVRVVTYGDCALLIDGLTPGVAAALREVVLRRLHNDAVRVIDVVPAATSLAIMHELGDGDAVRHHALAALDDSLTFDAERGITVEIPVRYDGEDLPVVAATLGCSVAEVIQLHSNASYVVEFCGFAPGFAYLGGLDQRLHLPRRASPRTRVPAGAVAIASSYSAVYPRESPGGWHLLGTTTMTLWDATRDQPALLQPGMNVRFRAMS